MDADLERHYSRLASAYDSTWAGRPEYLDWMERQIVSRLRLRRGERTADIGAGTGLFLRRLLEYADEETPVVCVDPSQPMLDRLPHDPRLLPLRATAEEFAEGARGPGGPLELPYPEFDAVLIKEAVHHFPDLPSTLSGLARRLAPGGRILIVTLPPKLEYPLFRAALDRFAAHQPEPEHIEAALRRAGLETRTTYAQFPVAVERDHWMRLVAGRWMSVLSTFSDAELADGLEEMAGSAAVRPGGVLHFPDRFAFVEGRAAPAADAEAPAAG